MTKRRNFMYLGALLIAALFAFGCSSGDSTGTVGPAGPPGPPGPAPEEDSEADTSELEAAIEALEAQIATLQEAAAEPMAPPEILSGEKSKLTVADIAAASKKVAGQLNALYDDDGDAGKVNLQEIAETGANVPVNKDVRTRDVTHASQLDMDADGAPQFLKNTFAGTGTKVDLSSMGDIDTLTLGRLLKVDGVELMSFSVRETDKVLVEKGPVTAVVAAAGVAAVEQLDAGLTRTTTLGKDGSSSVVTVNDITGLPTSSMTTTYVGGTKIVEQPLLAGTSENEADAVLTMADGSSVRYNAETTALNYTSMVTAATVPPTSLPATGLSTALMAYKDSPGAHHAALGHGLRRLADGQLLRGLHHPIRD